MKKFSKLAWTAAALTAAVISLQTPFPAFAEEESTEESILESMTEQSSELSEISLEELLEEYVESEETNAGGDYYSDDYYDTDGNATLIANQQIIWGSAEMQFISVTTKDGSVFYILINYSDEDNVDNVYFLNKVDDYDLYALLYADNEDAAYSTAAEAAEAATGNSSGSIASSDDSVTAEDSDTDSESEEAQDTEDTAETETSSGSSNLMIYGIGAVAIAAGAFFFWQKKKGGKKKTGVSDPEFDEEENENDGSFLADEFMEEEINEDEEV